MELAATAKEEIPLLKMRSARAHREHAGKGEQNGDGHIGTHVCIAPATEAADRANVAVKPTSFTR